MPEFDYFNGENFITFDLIEIDDEKREVTVAVSDTGRISVKTFDLLFDGNRRYKGVKCHALFNWFVCQFYADDVYRRVKE